MDHQEQHHQHHQKEREHKKHEQKLHEQAADRKQPFLHPLWFVAIGGIVILAAVLIWTLYPW